MKSSLRLALGLAIAIALMALVLRGVSLSGLGSAVSRAEPRLLAAVVVLTIVTYAIRAARWKTLLPALRNARTFDLLAVTFIGFFAGLAIPRAGEVVRPALIRTKHGVPISAGFASIILERLFDLLTVLVLVALYMFVLPRPAAEIDSPLMTTLRSGAAAAFLGAILGLIFLVQLRRSSGKAQALLGRLLALLPEHFQRRAGALASSFVDGLALFDSSPALWVRLGAESLALWLGIALLIHANDLAFGFPLPFHSSFLIIAFLTVGVAIPTPGMVGGFHAAYTLAQASVYGIDRERAAAAGLVLHALQNLPVLVLGLVFLAREGLTLGAVRALGDADGGGPPAGEGDAGASPSASPSSNR